MSNKNFVMSITPLCILFGRECRKEAVKIDAKELMDIPITTYVFSPSEAKLLMEYLKSMLEVGGW